MQIHLQPESTAFFLDFDGTLAEIAGKPDQAVIHPGAREMLRRLVRLAKGAVAVISGRSVAQLDAMLSPLHLPLAGIHGAERRDAAGKVYHAIYDREAERSIASRVRGFARMRSGLVVETKPGAVALHYRQRPELEADSLAFAAGFLHEFPTLAMLRGKMVVELTLSRRNKGDAIADFMREAPFAGRTAFFAGDDFTDEAGFETVNRMGGVTVKIGAGATSAQLRVASIAELVSFLEQSTIHEKAGP